MPLRPSENDFSFDPATQLELDAAKKKVDDLLVNVKDFGAKGDGVTDDTAAIQAALDYATAKRLRIVFPSGNIFMIDTLNIKDKSGFSVDNHAVLKRLPSSKTVGALIKLQNCSDFRLVGGVFDGNGLANGCVETSPYAVEQEQKHSIILLTCSQASITNVTFLNSSGDCIYVSGGSDAITINGVLAKSDTQIGRNIVSLISCNNVIIDNIIGKNFGHYSMPGGIDIEPNAVTESVTNVIIGKVSLIGGGSNPFSIMATNGSTVDNISADSVSLVRTNVLHPAAETASVYLTGTNIKVSNLTVVNKTAFNISFLNVLNQGKTPKNINVVRAYAENVYRGLSLGFGNLAVEDVKLNLVLRNIKLDGATLFTGKNIELSIDVDSVGSDRFPVNKPSGGSVVENLTISGNISKRGSGLKAIIIGDIPANVISWNLKDLDFTGWVNNERLFGPGFQGDVRKQNCKNLTSLAALPNFDNFKQGDVIWNIGTDNSVSYWRRLTNGTGNVLNTDWKAY